MQLQEAIKRLFYWAIQSVRAVARHLVGFLTSPHVTFLIGEPTFWLLGMRGRRRKNDLSQVKRVLVVRLDEIGDVVLTTISAGAASEPAQCLDYAGSQACRS